MGKIKYRQAVLEFIAKTPVVTLASLKKMAGERYVHLLVHTLIKKRELYRLARGCYSRREDPTLTVFCFQPAYLGLQNALSIHNLWEQETNAIILTTKTVREGRRTVCGNNVLLYRIPPSWYFGVEYVKYGGRDVPVSDREKTLLDFVYFRQPLEKEVLRVLKRRVDKKKLRSYLRQSNREFRRRFEKETGWKV